MTLAIFCCTASETNRWVESSPCVVVPGATKTAESAGICGPERTVNEVPQPTWLGADVIFGRVPLYRYGGE